MQNAPTPRTEPAINEADINYDIWIGTGPPPKARSRALPAGVLVGFAAGWCAHWLLKR